MKAHAAVSEAQRSELAGAASGETKAEPTGGEAKPRVDPVRAEAGIPPSNERDPASNQQERSD